MTLPVWTHGIDLTRPIGDGAGGMIARLEFRAPLADDEFAESAPAPLLLDADTLASLVRLAETAQAAGERDVSVGDLEAANVKAGTVDLAGLDFSVSRHAVDPRAARHWAKTLVRGVAPDLLDQLTVLELCNIGVQLALVFFMGFPAPSGSGRSGTSSTGPVSSPASSPA